MGYILLSRDASFEIFGKVGLYYIMFLASLGMNLTDVQRYRWGALAFGTISFVLPMALGFLANRWGLGLSFPAAVLVAAMYSGHTLLTYPLVMRWGLARHRSVGMAVGGTILTNVLTLVVLAVVGGVYKPDGGDFNVWHLLGRVALVTAGLFLVMPSLARWFFRRFDEGVVQYVFVLVLVFLGAGLMEWAGMEGLLGAFLVGIVLNREIPAVGPLMQRIEFVGNVPLHPLFSHRSGHDYQSAHHPLRLAHRCHGFGDDCHRNCGQTSRGTVGGTGFTVFCHREKHGGRTEHCACSFGTGDCHGGI